MKEQHLEYEIRLRITVCTEMEKKTLIGELDNYIESMPECFACIRDYAVDNVRLCECTALEDKLQEDKQQ